MVSEDAIFLVVDKELVALDPQHHFVIIPQYRLTFPTEIAKAVLSSTHNRLALALLPIH